MKLSLPKFKVTQIGDTTTHRNVPRGRKEAGCAVNLACSPCDTAVDDDVPEIDLELNESETGPTAPCVSLHAIKQKASAAQVRATLQKAAIESSALPSDQGMRIMCQSCDTPLHPSWSLGLLLPHLLHSGSFSGKFLSC